MNLDNSQQQAKPAGAADAHGRAADTNSKQEEKALRGNTPPTLPCAHGFFANMLIVVCSLFIRDDRDNPAQSLDQSLF